MDNKTKRDYIELLFIYSLIIICSCQGIIATINTHIDEGFLLLFFMYEFFKALRKKTSSISKRPFLFLTCFIIITVINLLIRKYDGRAYITEIINYLKIPIILLLPSLCNVSKEDYYKIIKFFVIINLISALVGIIHFSFYDKIGYRVGDKFRNGKLRPDGLSGHPISLGFASFLSVFFCYELRKADIIKKPVYIFYVLTFIYSLYLTQDRLPQFMLLVFIVIRLVLNIVSKIKKGYNVVLPIVAMISFVSLLTVTVFNFEHLESYLQDDINNTIRFYSLQKSIEVVKKYPLLGTGIGTFGCTASKKYNSYVYDEFDIKEYSYYNQAAQGYSSNYESFIAKLLIEVGLFGIISYLFLFLSFIKNAKKTKNYHLVYLLLCVLGYSLLNSIYQIPFILGIGILIAFSNKSSGEIYGGE